MKTSSTKSSYAGLRSCAYCGYLHTGLELQIVTAAYDACLVALSHPIACFAGAILPVHERSQLVVAPLLYPKRFTGSTSQAGLNDYEHFGSQGPNPADSVQELVLKVGPDS